MKKFVLLFFALTFMFCSAAAFAQDDGAEMREQVSSADGSMISFIANGGPDDKPALFFIHGWCCDLHYWDKQVDLYAGHYAVITMDLAGHGESDATRENYTVRSFAEDVAAVVNSLPMQKIILVGHSMGGAVALEAVPLISGDKEVLGVVGADSLQDISYKADNDEKWIVAKLQKDFPGTVENMVRSMLRDDDPEINDSIVRDMASAPPAVGISAMRNLLAFDLAACAHRADTRIYCITCDMREVNEAVGRRHARSFDVGRILDSDHFLMIKKPDDFNQEIAFAIDILTRPITEGLKAGDVQGVDLTK